MTKIKVTILCVGAEEFPRCSDLLDMCPEIAILAQPASMSEALGCMDSELSNILILDEAAILQAGGDAIHRLHLDNPTIRSLLIIDNDNKNNVIPALSLGIQGVIRRDSLPAALCKAVAALYMGEPWISRQMVEPLRDELIYLNSKTHWKGQSQPHTRKDKMN